MLIEKPFQVSTGVGALGFGDCSGWALSDDFASALAPFRAEIDHRIRGGDGALHIPETPLSRLVVAADSTVVIRENFILEIADAQTANEIRQMNIVLF